LIGSNNMISYYVVVCRHEVHCSGSRCYVVHHSNPRRSFRSSVQ